MKFIKTELEGVYIIENKIFEDKRGRFFKTFNKNIFLENGIDVEFRESYYSISKKDVIRGMHFQIPPKDHEKLVYVAKGKVLDVILDLRKNSKSFGKSISIELTSENGRLVFIPKGLAHGFKSLEDDTMMVYNVATEYENECDFGISWDSFNFEWKVKDPIISERDKNFESFVEFIKREIF